MTAESARKIVEAYLAAIGARDFEAARTYLADRNFSYLSPIMNFTNPDEFVRNISFIGPILLSIEIRRAFADGNDVCQVLRFNTRLSKPTATDVVH